MMRNQLSSVSSCCDWRAFCGVATTMETGLFEIQAQQLHDYRQLLSNSRDHTVFRRVESASGDATSLSAASNIETLSDSGSKADATAVEFARCFLRLANL